MTRPLVAKSAPATSKAAVRTAPVEKSGKQAGPKAPSHVAETRLDVGMPLPAATLLDQHGNSFRLASLKGAWTVVYFYPRDDTSGCTREACAFQSQLAALTRLGVAVVGISPDSVARHAKFADKYGLGFTLLVDEDRSYTKTCGVLVPKTLYGKTSIGIERSTFLIDKKGIVRRTWRKVRVDGHVEQVVAAIRELG